MRQRLAGLRLRFRDPPSRRRSGGSLPLNLGNVRFAFLAGIAFWIGWGILLRPYMLALSDLQLDAHHPVRCVHPDAARRLRAHFTPLLPARLGMDCRSRSPSRRIVIWVYYASHILTLPAEYGYVGVILITAFTYTLLRLRFILVVMTALVGIAAYLPYAFTARYIVDVSGVLATLYLVSFGGPGLARRLLDGTVRTRQLFLRQRELDQERRRDPTCLLLNILPQAVVEQLKTSSGERIAEAFDDVSVIFVDAVGSTEQAARSSPEEFAAALDELFRWFDELADRHGLEKIKTIGDAYMAVAGAPVPDGRPCRRRRRHGARDRRRVATRCGGHPATRSGCAVGSPADRSSPASSVNGSSPTTCGATP